MARILLVEDNKVVGDLLLVLIGGMGHDVTLATSGAAGLELLGRFNHEIILTDIHMEPMNGFDFIAKVKERHPRSIFVFISGDVHPDILARGMKMGALEFLHKPVRVEEFKQVLKRALNRVEKGRGGKDPTTPASPPAPRGTLDEITHELESFFPGKALSPLRKNLGQLLTVNRHALIEAPTGMLNAGLLRLLHSLGAFATGPLVVRDAAAEPLVSAEELLASVDGGLLVLLNLEAIPVAQQDELTAQLRTADKLRVIATTRFDPDKLMVEGKLSGALYSRLALCALRLPPLAELEAKIPDILAAALQKTPAYSFGKAPIEIDATAAQALRSYDWPEGLTELWSVANSVVAHMKEPRLSLAHLPERICGARLPRLESFLRLAEAQHVQRALRVLGTVPQAAEMLGVSPAELEAYQVPGAAESFFTLKRNVPVQLPPPAAVERLLLVAGDEVLRSAVAAGLAGKDLEVVAVADGLAAIAAVILSARPFAAAVVIPPLAVLDPEELGAQLARLDPRLRLGLLGQVDPNANPTSFQVVAPEGRTSEDVEALLEKLLRAVAERPAA